MVTHVGLAWVHCRVNQGFQRLLSFPTTDDMHQCATADQVLPVFSDSARPVRPSKHAEFLLLQRPLSWEKGNQGNTQPTKPLPCAWTSAPTAALLLSLPSPSVSMKTSHGPGLRRGVTTSSLTPATRCRLSSGHQDLPSMECTDFLDPLLCFMPGASLSLCALTLYGPESPPVP